MDGSRYRCSVISPDGVSRRVGGQGLLIGRDPACDIVVADPAISRRHALIRASIEGVELVPLGRLPVGHNGRPCERAQLLADGDRIEVAELVFTVKVELPAPGRTQTGYRLVRGRSSFALSHTPFVAAGGDTDDLILERWPAGALRFHLAQGELFVEVVAGGATRLALAPGSSGQATRTRCRTTHRRTMLHGAAWRVLVDRRSRGGRYWSISRYRIVHRCRGFPACGRWELSGTTSTSGSQLNLR